MIWPSPSQILEMPGKRKRSARRAPGAPAKRRKSRARSRSAPLPEEDNRPRRTVPRRVTLQGARMSTRLEIPLNKQFIPNGITSMTDHAFLLTQNLSRSFRYLHGLEHGQRPSVPVAKHWKTEVESHLDQTRGSPSLGGGHAQQDPAS